MSELKACPFCGSTDLRAFMERSRDGQPSHGIQCNGSDCAIAGPERDTPEAAIAAWNRRAPLPTVTREELAKVIHSKLHDPGVDGKPSSDIFEYRAADALLALLREKGVIV